MWPHSSLLPHSYPLLLHAASFLSLFLHVAPYLSPLLHVAPFLSPAPPCCPISIPTPHCCPILFSCSSMLYHFCPHSFMLYHFYPAHLCYPILPVPILALPCLWSWSDPSYPVCCPCLILAPSCCPHSYPLLCHSYVCSSTWPCSDPGFPMLPLSDPSASWSNMVMKYPEVSIRFACQLIQHKQILCLLKSSRTMVRNMSLLMPNSSAIIRKASHQSRASICHTLSCLGFGLLTADPNMAHSQSFPSGFISV